MPFFHTLSRLALCLSALPGIVSAESKLDYAWLQKDQYCFLAIYKTLSTYTYSDSFAAPSVPPSPLLNPINSGACESAIEVVSLYASARSYCTAKEFKAAVPLWQDMCQKAGLELMDLNSTGVVANLTNEYIDHLPIIDPLHNSTNSTPAITSPVLLSASYYVRAHRSWFTLGVASAKDGRFAWVLMGYWLGIIFIGAVCRIISFCAKRRTRAKWQTAEDGGYNMNMKRPASNWVMKSRVGRFFKHYLMDPPGLHPIFPNNQVALYGNTIPTRLDSLIITIWWCLCIILCAVKYDTFKGNTM